MTGIDWMLTPRQRAALPPTACPSCGGGIGGDVPAGDVCVCQRFEWGPVRPLRLWQPETGEAWRVRGHLLACRSGHRCEVCGEPFVAGEREPSIHHRRNLAGGGTVREDKHDLPNTVLACAGFSRRLAGVLGCHGWIEHNRAAARTRGLLVPQTIDPATVPVTLHSGRIVYLAADSPMYLDPPGGPRWSAA